MRLPSDVGYVAQVEKEHRWLPRLAPLLPLPIPVPLAQGNPSQDYPWPWSIYRWIPGETVVTAHIADLTRFAITVAQFLAALQRIDSAGGPSPGHHSAFRGGPLTTYDTETRHAIVALKDQVDAEVATIVWEAALNAPWHGPAVWFHGDVAVGNLLVQNGQLSAVIDWGCSGVGDPACDVTIVIFWLSQLRD